MSTPEDVIKEKGLLVNYRLAEAYVHPNVWRNFDQELR